MSLSLPQKQNFYLQLGQLLRAGIPIGVALEKLERTSRGTLLAFLRSVRGHLDGGATIGEAFHKARPALTELEQATLSGISRAGQMERGLTQLSHYFAGLHQARRLILKRLGYPLFVLHFAVLVKNILVIVGDGGVEKYLLAIGRDFLILYAFFVAAALIVPFLLDAGSFLTPIDYFLRKVPFLGKMRRSFAVSRFCATYNMQLEAGVNVMDSLRAAGRASRSGLIRSAVQSALPGLRKGAQVGELLAPHDTAFPESMLSSFLVAEETGHLDRTLEDLARDHQEDAFRRLDTAAEWIPRIIYISIAIFVGWVVIRMGSWYVNLINSIGETP